MRSEISSQMSNLLAFRRLFGMRAVINKLRGYPLAVNILLSADCNLSCRICSEKKMLHSYKELTTENWTGFIDDIAAFRPVLFFGGGEPFLREDIFALFAHIRKKKMSCGVVTNGLLLDAERSSRLLESPPDVVIFSLHGLKDVHEKMVGQPGSFSVLCENIKRIAAKRKKTRLMLNCVVNEENYLSLDKMAELGKKLGVDMVRFEHLIFLTPGEYDEHLRLCREKFPAEDCGLSTYIRKSGNREIGQSLKKTIKDLENRFGNFVLFKPYLNGRELEGWYVPGFDNRRRCLFVKHSLFVLPNGDVVPCQFFDKFVLGNVRKEKFLPVWRSEKRRRFSRSLSERLLPGCARCCKL